MSSKDCCKITDDNIETECYRKSDSKFFSLPRKFSKKRCLNGRVNGFTMRSSCAPFLECRNKSSLKSQNFKKGKNTKKYKKNKKEQKVKKDKIEKTKRKQNGGRKTNKHQPQFLYNPNNPKKSFDVYINKNPSDTISIKYTSVDDVKQTIEKLERLYKSKRYPHKRIWQVGMILKVRLEAMKKHQKTKYPNAKFITARFNLANRYFKFLGKRSKLDEDERYKLVFKLN